MAYIYMSGGAVLYVKPNRQEATQQLHRAVGSTTEFEIDTKAGNAVQPEAVTVYPGHVAVVSQQPLPGP